MNLAQKIAVAVTMVAVAVCLYLHGQDAMQIEYGRGYDRTFWYTTVFDLVGIVLVGGAVILLLGIKRKRPDAGG